MRTGVWQLKAVRSGLKHLNSASPCFVFLIQPSASEGLKLHEMEMLHTQLYLRELQPIAASRSATEMTNAETLLRKETKDCSLKLGR